MSTLSDLIRNSDSLTEFEAYITDIPKSDHTIRSLEIHEKELHRLWEVVRKTYDSLLVLAEGNPKMDIVAIKSKYRGSYEAYVRGVSLISEYVELLEHSSQNKDQERNFIPSAHLPPCEIDPFYGDYLKWPSFRESFKNMIGENPRIDSVSKMYYLLQYTKGEPHKMIRTCPLTSDGFPIAWKNLMERYENKRVLINAQLKILFNINPITRETGPNIKELQRTINDCITNLSLLRIETDSWDVIFVYIASTKLPDNTLNLWEQSEKIDADLPLWSEMDKFLTLRYKALESVYDIRGSQLNPQNSVKRHPATNPGKFNDSRKLKTFVAKTNSSQNVTPCVLCPEKHPLRLCSKFLGQSVDDRWLTVERLKFCSNCLASSHEYKLCKSVHVCFICRQKHHSLLHRNPCRNPNSSLSKGVATPSPSRLKPSSFHPNENNYRGPNYSPPQNNPDVTPSTSNDTRLLQTYASHVDSNPQSTVLLGTTTCEVMVGDIKYQARALIDPASQASFVSRKLQRKFCLPTISSTTAKITGLNCSLTATASRVCCLNIGSRINPDLRVQCEAYVVDKLTDRLPTCSTSDIRPFDFLDIDHTNVRYTHVDLLLGGDVYSQILLPEVEKHPNGNLVAQNTIFGWIVTGKVENGNPLQSIQSYFNQIDLNAQLTRFWELEEVPRATQLTDSDELCEKLYQSTTYRRPDGRYVVSLPFKAKYPTALSLGNSRSYALSQFRRNEARLLRNPEIKLQYDNVINEYLVLGHMKEVQPTATPDTSYYLPHHAVFKPDSTTTKLRVVFNASNKSSNSVSLNDILYPGPVLQSDLTILLLRWRLYRFVFNADIEKMYRQILVHPDHTPFQRILFRENPKDDVKDFELNTVTFGVNCAPYLAIRTLIHLAGECEAQNPAVSEILRTQMYVDDVLAGSHELDEAIMRRNDLTNVLGSAGFVLRKWTANHESLLEDLPKENLLAADFLKFSDTSMTKTLGLRWNASSDSFYFRLVTPPNKNLVTKRAVLSEIAKLFDPAGWLSPKIIVAKMIMQQIWRDKTDWDECLSPLTLNKWHKFLEDYPKIEEIHIPRWVNFHPDYDMSIHGFCDASERAYAAALYLRVVTPNREITCSLPVPPCHWPTFVANRVALILKKVGIEDWHHVDSRNNPADLASRGSLAQDLIDHSLWWHGPNWLRQPENTWPQTQIVYHTNLETKRIITHFTQTDHANDILKRFSNLPRALRVISYIFRFYNKLRKRSNIYHSWELVRSEIIFVKTRLTILAQQLYFSEYYQLQKGHSLSKGSKLLSLNPFLDSCGTMRVNGRLAQAAGLTYNERFPKILPYCAPFTRLYLNYVHTYSLHSGSSLLIRIVRREFWVPRLRNLVRTIINNCKECVIHRKRTSRQIMAALPPERTSIDKPFNHTGVDFAGPFDIKSYSGRGCRISKGYVVVFVCFGTKAIHLELTEDLSSEAFLAAFTRFISRRSAPQHMYSDNGTAFVGAAKLLSCDRRKFLQQLRNQVLSLNCVEPMEWHFIPPGAPHMGGLWEAGVKSFKTHLKRVASTQKFTYAEFETMLSRIEACLNSRPLCAMSDNPTDFIPLTPGHFLIGQPLLGQSEPDYSGLSISLANRWQKLKMLHHQFAIRWKEEYLKELHKRTKWKTPEKDIAIGDLVVVRQDNFPPNLWRLGRIDRIYYGQDAKVRVADVRTASGVITRPIVKLVLLPNSESN